MGLNAHSWRRPNLTHSPMDTSQNHKNFTGNKRFVQCSGKPVSLNFNDTLLKELCENEGFFSENGLIGRFSHH